MAFLFIVALECSFPVIDEGNDCVSVAGYVFFLDDHIVSIVNSIVDHALAFDLKDIGIFATNHERRYF